MKIDVLHLGLLRTNCYLISSPGAAIVIDPGFESEKAYTFLENAAGKERMILITHAHFDHIADAPRLRAKTGAPIGIGQGDNAALSDDSVNLSGRFHAGIPPFSADRVFHDEETVRVGDLTFWVLETPGHTAGGVSYLFDQALFSGDTLFEGTVGRTDFPGGDLHTLKKSVRRLLLLDPDTVVYPGHDGVTTVARERATNLFAR